MAVQIHNTAVINPSRVKLGVDVTIGPYAIVEDGVEIGDRCSIGSHTFIGTGTTLDEAVQVYHGAVVGGVPQDLKYAGEETTTHVGARTIIREYVTIHRGTIESQRTVVGSDVLLMAYVHIAHDCEVGDHVIIANACSIGGHVKIDDWAIIGGMVPVHQFVKIGAHSFIAGGFRVTQDVPPYVRAARLPLTYNGVNYEGLKRRGFKSEQIRLIRQAYQIIYRSEMNTTQAMDYIEKNLEMTPEIKQILDFIRNSDRGIIRG